MRRRGGREGKGRKKGERMKEKKEEGIGRWGSGREVWEGVGKMEEWKGSVGRGGKDGGVEGKCGKGWERWGSGREVWEGVGKMEEWKGSVGRGGKDGGVGRDELKK